MVLRKQKEKQRKFKFWAMARKFRGYPKMSDFALEEREMRDLQDGDYGVEAVYWSVDPFNRTFPEWEGVQFGDGYNMVGFQVGKITESKTEEFPVGKLIVGQWGWRTHTVVKSKDMEKHKYPDPLENFPPYLLETLPVGFGKDKMPLSYALGVFGLTGLTAFYGLMDICKPRPGETVLINCAAGAVGSLAAQIAKIKGCKVVAFTGSDDKVEWLKSVGVENAFNYNHTRLDVDKTLKEIADKGIDCFMDMVGGQFATEVYPHLKKGARVCQCGNMSAYNQTERQKLHDFFDDVIRKEITIKGFNVETYASRLKGATGQLAKWIDEGKLKVKEQVYEGFDKMPQALIDQMDGKNTGKVIVRKM